MVNINFELDRLRSSLNSRGLEQQSIDIIIQKAEQEIMLALREKLDTAMEIAVQSGVQKDSADFINELRPRADAFTIETESGITDFSDPPLPMLDKLLSRNVKPISDGSGVYRVIPIGTSGNKPKKPIHTNIFDAQKSLYAERYESAVEQYSKIKPKQSKATFKTATSKQNRNTQWVLPAKEKDFTEDLKEVNSMLQESHDLIILDIIRSYEENF